MIETVHAISFVDLADMEHGFCFSNFAINNIDPA